MLSIAICDDEAPVREQLQGLLKTYCRCREMEIQCRVFCSPLDLLAEAERGIRFDVLLLDILMPGENGIHAAMELRRLDSNVKIIFLTNSAEYAVASYTVGAFYYQMKPVKEEQFFVLMDSVMKTCEKEKETGLLLRCKNGIHRVDIRNIEYCEILHRTLFVHLTDGRVLESIGSMEELCTQLQNFGNFLRPHRSYLVNLQHIQRISFRAILLCCGAQIPIPRGKYNDVKKAFLDFAFQNGQVIL